MDGKKKQRFKGATTHFFVTTIKTGIDTFELHDKVWEDEDSRCWGYTDTFEKAEEAVLGNYGDINETMYQWAVIEEHVMDVVAMGTGRFQWYHWSDQKECYERCKQPEWAKNVCHWGIG